MDQVFYPLKYSVLLHIATYFNDHDESSKQQLWSQASIDYNGQQALEVENQQKAKEPVCLITNTYCDRSCHGHGYCSWIGNACFC